MVYQTQSLDAAGVSSVGATPRRDHRYMSQPSAQQNLDKTVPHWAVVGLALINLGVVAIGLRAAWTVAGLRAIDAGEYSAQVQTLAAAVNLLIASVLAWITGYYAFLTRSLVGEAAMERLERADVRRSAQAELIGGYITSSVVGAGNVSITVHIANTSQLPVRALEAYVVDGVTDIELARYRRRSVLPPGLTQDDLQIAQGHPPLRLVLEYDDDAGRRWRKYGRSVPLECIADPYREP